MNIISDGRCISHFKYIYLLGLLEHLVYISAVINEFFCSAGTFHFSPLI